MQQPRRVAGVPDRARRLERDNPTVAHIRGVPVDAKHRAHRLLETTEQFSTATIGIIKKGHF